MPSRRKARECALQLLFQWDLARDLPERIQEIYWTNTRRSDDVALQAISNRLFYGAVESIQELDEAIRTHAENWRLERMPAVDRNLLRLAIYELTVGMENERTPPAVVINEALEIARRYSGEASIPFINGVLDGMRKSLGSAEAKPPLGASEAQS